MADINKIKLTDLLVDAAIEYNRTPGDTARYNRILGIQESMEVLGLTVKIIDSLFNDKISMILVEGKLLVYFGGKFWEYKDEGVKASLNSIYGVIGGRRI